MRMGSKLGCLFALCSCGGAPKKDVTPPTPIAVQVSDQPTNVVSAPLDISRAKAPQELLAWVHISDPKDSAERLADTLSLPKSLVKPAIISQWMTGDSKVDVIRTDLPVDIAVMLMDPGGMKVAESASLRSMDDAKKAFPNLVTAKNGFLRVVDSADGKADDDQTGHVCVISPSTGPTDARLVCGDYEAVKTAAPYLVRTLGTQTTKTDVHAELYMGPVRDTVQSMAGGSLSSIPMLLSGMIGMRAGNFLGGALEDALAYLGDAERVDLDLSLGNASADFVLSLLHGKRNSQIASFLTQHPDKNLPPPVFLSALGGNLDSAGFSHGVDWAPFASGKAAFLDAVDDITGERGVSKADRDAFRQSVEKAFAISAKASVGGTGVDKDAVDKAFTAAKGKKDKKLRTALARALDGYRIVGVQDNVDALEEAQLGFWRLMARPTVRAMIEKEFGKKIKVAGGLGRWFPGVRKGEAVSTLPASTRHYVVKKVAYGDLVTAFMGNFGPSSPKAESFDSHYLFVEKDGVSWSAESPDLALATKQLRDTLSPKADPTPSTAKGVLASVRGSGALFLTGRSVVAPMAEEKVRAGGDISSFQELWRQRELDEGAVVSARSRAPNAAAAGGSLELTVSIPKATISGLARLGKSSLMRSVLHP